MKKEREETFLDRTIMAGEIEEAFDAVKADLSAATCCENPTDFNLNLVNAIEEAEALVIRMKALTDLSKEEMTAIYNPAGK